MAYWACAQLEANRERLALHCLEHVAGFTVYSPRIAGPRRARKLKETRPLFPGYAFVWILAQWWAARWSPGMVRLVLDGAVPARVPDAIIADLKRREHDGVIALPRPPGFHAGDRVRVVTGPFAGQLALYAGMKPRERVEVLLALLGGQQRVILPKDSITPAGIRGCLPAAQGGDLGGD